MPNNSVHRVSDLALKERMLVERWLGRTLSEDETVSLTAYRPTPRRPAANARIFGGTSCLRPARSAPAPKGITEEEVDALLDEAFTDIRG